MLTKIKYMLTIGLLLFPFLSFSQSKINGIVKDKKGEPIFAVNIYLKSAPHKGVTSDFEGNFSLDIVNFKDTLIVSFIGYQTKEIPIENIDIAENIIIVLQEKSKTLVEIIITAEDPISEQFAVTKMDILKDVYLNAGISQGDPLKAITLFPVSTTTDESASQSLRGSSADRSRVILNEVPIYNPVRASNISNQGFFSLFNPEVIDNMYVYASNPPLTYGNTSAGLVEIQTKKNLKSNQLQLSTSLTNIGFFLSQKIVKDISFIQVYGNYQFSDAFVGIQKDNLPQIKNFYTKDLGVNFHRKFGKKGEFNSYSYYIDESFNGYNQSYTYKGSVGTLNKRIITVNNIKYYSKNGILSVISGTNTSEKSFGFGNINSLQKTSQIYTSINYKWYLLENTKIQFGISHDFHRNKFKDSIPVYYYALSTNSPNNFSEISIFNHNLEAHFYTNWDVNEKLTFSSGMRSNFPLENQKYYFSSQLGMKYRLNKKQSFLLSGGKYHNYSIPNYYSKTYNLLSSYQVALDYLYKNKNSLLKMAAYYKNETGEQSVNISFKTEKINTFGLELFLEHHFYKYFKFSLSNTFIDQKITIDNKDYNGSKDFNYFLKSAIQYNNSKIFSVTLSCISRTGVFYNEITGSTFDRQLNLSKPIFSNDLFSSQYSNYNRFDISISKYIKMKKIALITFISLNNIFNTKNESTALYNNDYSTKYFDFYQLRTIYFGLVWKLYY